MKKLLVTGCSSGLGKALCKLYLDEGWIVYGISRNEIDFNNKNFLHIKYDLSHTKDIKHDLEGIFLKIKDLDLVFLGAGVLGEIKEMTSLDTEKDIKPVLELNLFANKELLDILAKINTKLVIAISSGAAVNGSKGWGAYSLSKVSLNMLIKLYAKEMTTSKLLAVAPGVIRTPMIEKIIKEVDDEKFPSAKTLKQGEIQTPLNAAVRLQKLAERQEEFESGKFIDVRDL